MELLTALAALASCVPLAAASYYPSECNTDAVRAAVAKQKQ